MHTFPSNCYRVNWDIMYSICFIFFIFMFLNAFFFFPIDWAIFPCLLHMVPRWSLHGSPNNSYMGTNMLTQKEVLGWLPSLVCANCGMLQMSWLGPHPTSCCFGFCDAWWNYRWLPGPRFVSLTFMYFLHFPILGHLATSGFQFPQDLLHSSPGNCYIVPPWIATCLHRKRVKFGLTYMCVCLPDTWKLY